MSIKIYTNDIPKNILEQLKSLNIVANKDHVKVVYVNTFLSKIRDANVLTSDKLVHWHAKIVADGKNIISFKKLKDITYEEKGLYGTIIYHLSSKKTFELKLNRQDAERFMQLSLELWNSVKNN